MDPDLRHVLSRYERFLREAEPALEIAKAADVDAQPPSRAPVSPVAKLQALADLASELAPEGSARSESLRTVIVRVHAALTAVTKVKSLAGLSTTDSSDPDVVSAVETW